ncbi:uroporphyrinogen-III synthase [Terrilactibacillus sp. BCM23-1]|uniref:Uroporphyrinogen-III synthase n=1 Tax=Terrilactibacillus tamarindi TaxID=2599694 RepID=A0A6N8CP96_9BACI|nr:uroporphyrinogen-III synthase [Terrilactibacillus tamarindi]MTT30967.1 uroporphyrinogen-III synthase [Terrilactibacillus tamarindi]
MKGLVNKRIGIAAERQAETIATLVTKHGGSPTIHSIQGQWLLNDEICKNDVKTLVNGSFDWVVLTTGIGARTLEEAAEKLNEKDRFLQSLQKTPLAIRGSKTLKWLKGHNLVPERVSEDGTMEHLISMFKQERENEKGKRVYLQLYDQDDVELKQQFESLGFDPYLSKPYSYKQPDPQALKLLTEQIIEQSLDAVVFTSKTQVRNLFSQVDRKEALVKAFNDRVLAVAVGKVTAGVLEEQGIEELIQPENQKMGQMIVRLSEYYEETSLK